MIYYWQTIDEINTLSTCFSTVGVIMIELYGPRCAKCKWSYEAFIAEMQEAFNIYHQFAQSARHL